MTTIASIMRQRIHRALLVLAVATVATQSVQAAEVHPSVPSEVTLEWLAGAFQGERAQVERVEDVLFVTFDEGFMVAFYIDALSGTVNIATHVLFRHGVSDANKDQVVRRISDARYELASAWDGPLLLMSQRVPNARLRTQEDVWLAVAELGARVLVAISEAGVERYLRG